MYVYMYMYMYMYICSVCVGASRTPILTYWLASAVAE